MPIDEDGIYEYFSVDDWCKTYLERALERYDSAKPETAIMWNISAKYRYSTPSDPQGETPLDTQVVSGNQDGIKQADLRDPQQSINPSEDDVEEKTYHVDLDIYPQLVFETECEINGRKTLYACAYFDEEFVDSVRRGIVRDANKMGSLQAMNNRGWRELTCRSLRETYAERLASKKSREESEKRDTQGGDSSAWMDEVIRRGSYAPDPYKRPLKDAFYTSISISQLPIISEGLAEFARWRARQVSRSDTEHSVGTANTAIGGNSTRSDPDGDETVPESV